MSVSVGTLTIDLLANTATFTKSMEKAAHLSAKSATDISKSLQKITAMGVAMSTAIGTGLAAFVNSGISTIGHMSRLAQAAGTTTEKFSVLSYAAKRSHIEVEDMAKGMGMLAKSSLAAQNGNQVLSGLFKRLGVDVEESKGHLKDTSDIFTQLAVKFSQMGTGAGKVALAKLIFGKSGASLIPELNDLGKHLTEITEEAKRFGLVIGNDVPAKAGLFKEGVKKLDAAMEGFKLQLAAGALPALGVLSQRMIKLGSQIDIPKLAQQFGEKLGRAITIAGDAMVFVVQHAHALKIALEGLAAIKIISVFGPFIAEASTSGALMAGLTKATMKMTGLGSVAKGLGPVFASLGTWITSLRTGLYGLSFSEGLALIASRLLAGGLAVLTAPITLVVGGLALLSAGMYYFRDSTFSAKGEVYKLRDAYLALWQVLTFQNKGGEKTFTSVLARIKKEREESEKTAPGMKPYVPGPPTPDTSDLTGKGSKDKKDVYGEEIKRLDQAAIAAVKLMSVMDAGPDKIQAVTAAMHAQSEILRINSELHQQGKAALTEEQRATLTQKFTLEETLKALDSYGTALVSERHASELATMQARNMAAAILEGDEAVRQAVIENKMLGLTYGKTALSLSLMKGELDKAKVAAEDTSRADMITSITQTITGLKDELAQRMIITAATIQGGEAYRDAALQVKLYNLNEQIQKQTNPELLAALEAKRAAIIEVDKAERDEADAQEARNLRSPIEVYQEEAEKLQRAIAMLKTATGGTLTFGHQVMIAAKEVEIFNTAIDNTVKHLLMSDKLRDGMNAFFLEMQKKSQQTASIIYDAFHSAFEKISDNLTQLITGGKTSFAQMFKDIGRQMVNSAIKQEMQKGLGALGQKLGINLGGALANKPDGTKGNPWNVRIVGGGGTGNGVADGIGGILGKLGGDQGDVQGMGKDVKGPLDDIMDKVFSGIKKPGESADDKSGPGGMLGKLGGLGGLLAKLIPHGHPNLNAIFGGALKGITAFMGKGGLFGGLFGGGGGGGLGGLFSKLFDGLGGLGGGESYSTAGAMASGGSVSPDKAYLVGEKGPEILHGMSGNIASNADSRRLMGGVTHNYHNYIDARGTDPRLVEQHVNRAMAATYQGAVRGSLQATSERQRRTPHG